MRRMVARFGACIALAACASPTPTYFLLAAISGDAQVVPHSLSVELRRVSVPGYLDRSEIVHSTADYTVRSSDRERWGEPVSDMVDRVFTEDLVQRLPNASVFTESGAISTKPDVVVEVDLLRLDADATGQVVLLAQVAVRREQDDRTRAETVRLIAIPSTSATRDLVAAESSLLGRLADQVAARLTT